MTYDQIHPVSGLWPEWSRPVMLTYDSGEDKELTKLFWNNPRRFVGCARCGIIHPLTGSGLISFSSEANFSIAANVRQKPGAMSLRSPGS
jgi:hypothetical protein